MVNQQDIDNINGIINSARLGDAESQFKLAKMHYEGNAVITKDIKEAAKWFEEAAKNGHAMAQYNIGIMYLTGEVLSQSDVEAAKWFEEAAEQGHAMAQHNLGLMYYKGVGVISKDNIKAEKWFRLAAEQELAKAQFYLACIFYEEGEEVPHDYKEALKWFLASAKQGYAEAQFMLGKMYFKGEGTPESPMHAYMWLSIAKVNGNQEVQELLDEMIEELPQDKLIEAQWHAAKCISSNYKNCE